MIKDTVTNLKQEIVKLSDLLKNASPAQLVQRHEILTTLTIITEVIS